VNDELVGTWKESAVAFLKLIVQSMLEGTGGNHGESEREQKVPGRN
jgi:hypothetical protein